MSKYSDELVRRVVSEVCDVRDIKNKIEGLSEKEAFVEIDKLSYSQLKTLVQLYVMGVVG